MKQFDIPTLYRSPVLSRIKEIRKQADPRKKDFSPTLLDLGPVRFYLARHFGFCYGVENAIEIAYKTLENNPGKRIFLLSEMVHNPDVNRDLLAQGIRFIKDTTGTQLIPWEELKAQDIVMIPAFGASLEVMAKLAEMGIATEAYNTTCPFVVKVWNRAEDLGKQRHSIVIHGKLQHEETRATASHSQENAPTLVVRDLEETEKLVQVILGKVPEARFYEWFEGKYSAGFEAGRDLDRIGVVNQTTMLATETQAIADRIKQAFIEKYGQEGYQEHFADTRDTLCYATNDNQKATYGLLETPADLAIVVGGYNSSNTSHLVELCAEKFPTYFISSAAEIISPTQIRHFNYEEKAHLSTENWLPRISPLNIILTSGASCPDALVEEVMIKITGYFEGLKDLEEVMSKL